MEKETIFAEGIYFDRPHENAPDFIKGKLSVHVQKAIPFLQQNMNDKGFVNIDLKVSKAGKLYLQLNTYKKDASTDKIADDTADAISGNIPF